MAKTVLGHRIRERRRQIGITQVELARRIGISGSYLNMIERNKRQIAGALLRRTAEALALGLDELDGAAEHRLFESLEEIAQLPALRGLEVEAAKAEELIARFPGWARALASLARSESLASQTARTLADRLTHDPFLGETVHRMLTSISAIRMASEILTDYADLPAQQGDRFQNVINVESLKLSETGEALAAYFDSGKEGVQTLTPVDEVEALFDANENRFEEIEIATRDLAGRLSDPTRVATVESARAMVEEDLDRYIAEFVARQRKVETSAAGARARRALADYAAGALLMPIDAFAPRAAALRYDAEALAAAFSVGVEAVCKRLTALPQGTGAPRFGYFRANAAGTIIEMLGLPGLSVPRYADTCPLWVLYRAQQAPGEFLRQRATFPNGDRFVFVARARNTASAGFAMPRHYVTDMLAMSEESARATVYAPDPSVPSEEVGPACRLCARIACPHRVEDPWRDEMTYREPA